MSLKLDYRHSAESITLRSATAGSSRAYAFDPVQKDEQDQKLVVSSTAALKVSVTRESGEEVVVFLKPSEAVTVRVVRDTTYYVTVQNVNTHAAADVYLAMVG